MADNSPAICIIEDDDLETYKHSLAEVEDYALYLGLDAEHERDLFWIAEAGLTAPLPAPWRACQVDGDDDLFYFNIESGESVWDHPSDHVYFKMVEDERERRIHVAITLTAEVVEGAVTIVGTNLAGSVVASTVVSDAKAQEFSFVEMSLTEGLSLAAGSVPRFVLRNATLLGFSHRSRSVAEIFSL